MTGQETLYWARALDLVAEELTTITPERFDERRWKLIAIIRNVAYRKQASVTLPPEWEYKLTNYIEALQTKRITTRTLWNVLEVEPTYTGAIQIAHIMRKLNFTRTRVRPRGGKPEVGYVRL